MTAVDYKRQISAGKLHTLDQLDRGDDSLGPAIKEYADSLNGNKKSVKWTRTVRYIENFLFSAGRHYINDLLVSRISNSSSTEVGDLSLVERAVSNIPKPTNDLLGRYIETNVSLLTDNKPRPRVTSKSDSDKDETAAELSELTLEYLWEALDLPEKIREVVRLILHTGIAWIELCYDPTVPRRIQVPKTRVERNVKFPEGTVSLENIPAPEIIPREVPIFDKEGNPVYSTQTEYGDIKANIISPFAFHCPSVHVWNGDDMGWVMKEEFVSIDSIKDKYLKVPKTKAKLTSQNGWDLSILEDIKDEQIMTLPLWWWQRLTELVEGPGPNLYIGSPDDWEGYTVVRTFDRAPNPTWPKGRTIITVGDKVLYDSPKKVGARAYDERWPTRWHPYIRFRWEPLTGSIYGRSLLSKLLPKLKRINAIDTTLIMYRRTVPIAAWLAPAGTKVIEDQWAGMPGLILGYDPRRTGTHAPQQVPPTPYPAALLQEREQQILEMESIAGTEEILRGQRPAGVTSGVMLSALRQQALASRSPILQAWDESLEHLGSAMLQETIKHIGKDTTYAEALRILAREKVSTISISEFSGADLSDNVQVRVDTASLALVSKEAREAKVLEVLQYLPSLQAVDDIGLRQAILEELGLKKALMPSGPDVHRAKKMIGLIKQSRFDRIVIHAEDDPYIFHAMLVNEMKSDGFIDLTMDQQRAITDIINIYKKQIEMKEQLQMQAHLASMQLMANLQNKPPGGNQ